MIYNTTLSMTSKPPVLTAKLQRSVRSKRKYQVTLSQVSGVSGVSPQWGPSVKIVHFGHPDFLDFTQNGADEQRKKNYIARHKKREHWNDPYTPGFWARWLLWNKPTIKEAKEDITKTFGIRFI